MEKKILLTIGRQFGSGGLDIGRLLAKELQIPLWDKDILRQASEDTGISTEIMKEYDEKPTNSFLYSLVMGLQAEQSPLIDYNVPLSEKASLAQFDTIRKLAENGSGIFVGRCADYALRDFPCLRVFIYAPLEDRILRVCERTGVDEKTAHTKIEKTDKRRSSYYGHFTLQKWGDMNHYDLCINSSVLGLEKTAELIRTMLEQMD